MASANCEGVSPGAQSPSPQQQQQQWCARYSINQRKLGPAPFASFDQDVGSIEGGAPVPHQSLPPVPSSPTPPQSSTPTTPHIAISTATTPSSNSSDSEHELFHEKLFKLEVEDLRSSTEELAREEDKRSGSRNGSLLLSPREEMLRRASQPMLFSRRGSQSPDYEIVRKWSVAERPKSSCSQQWRSHSPFSTANYYSSQHPRFLLETSFCGSKPIPTPSMDIGDGETSPEEEEAPPPTEPLAQLQTSSPKSSWHWRSVNCTVEAVRRVSPSSSEENIGEATVINHRESPGDGISREPPTEGETDQVPPQKVVPQKTVLDMPPPPPEFSNHPPPAGGASSSSSSSSLSSLPSLPTTLPTSRPSTTITPSQYRYNSSPLSIVERPRCSSKLEPSKIESFINSNTRTSHGNNLEKISIRLPSSGSIEEEDKTSKRRVSSDWGQFAELGLSSPGRGARRGSSK